MVKIWAYQRYSTSAKALARRLGYLRIVSTNYKQQRRDFLINWGKSDFTPRDAARVLNHPDAVRMAADKVLAFQALQRAHVRTPTFTLYAEEAQAWLRAGFKVVARTLTRSHSGKGAIVVSPGETLPHAPLYTEYVRRDAEYRVHVFNGEVLDAVKKKRRQGYEADPRHNEHIRTHANGWVFCRDGVEVPTVVTQECIKAVAALGLDFGAVDVLYRMEGSKATVLEVNTAPGLVGTTLEKYAYAMRAYVLSKRLR